MHPSEHAGGEVTVAAGGSAEAAAGVKAQRVIPLVSAPEAAAASCSGDKQAVRAAAAKAGAGEILDRYAAD